MGIKFPSADWTAAFKDAINANGAYRQAAAQWTHGKVAYVVKARPELGIAVDQAMVLDLHQGVCREASFLDAEQLPATDFVVVGEYERWKEVLSGEADPTKAMMQNKLKVTEGHVPTLIKFVVASRELVQSASHIETDYPS